MEGSWRKYAPHNVTVVRLPDQRYAMLFIARSEKSSVQTQKIGMMLATSLDGPWKLAGQDGLILDMPTDPAVWCYKDKVVNPSLLPMPDGRFFLYFKSGKHRKSGPTGSHLGVAIADKVDGPYIFHKTPVTANQKLIEDGFAFLLNGEVCLLATQCGTDPWASGGIIYRSKDGIHFDPTPIHAYETVDHYMKLWPQTAKGWGERCLQRPALLLGADGIPTHLFAPCGRPPEGKKGTSTFLFEIKPGK